MKRNQLSSASSRRLSWSQISEFFQGEWVELVDYKWDWKQPFPTLGRVRHHAVDRNDLLTQIRSAEAIEGSVVLYLGVSRSSFEYSLSAAV